MAGASSYSNHVITLLMHKGYVMRHASHKTWIAIILEHVNAWRRAHGWSRETVVQHIVEAHERIDGPRVTGIKFEPHTADAFERQKVNADKVFRWLDDATKDTNFLPTNFIQSILTAMPDDIRLHCIDDLLRSLGVAGRSVAGGGDGGGQSAVGLLRGMLAENAEAQQAVAELVDGATREELLAAQRELTESAEATTKALSWVEAALTQNT